MSRIVLPLKYSSASKPGGGVAVGAAKTMGVGVGSGPDVDVSGTGVAVAAAGRGVGVGSSPPHAARTSASTMLSTATAESFLIWELILSSS